MPEQALLHRIRCLTAFFILGLLVSGATAIPLVPELNWLLSVTGESGAILSWVAQVRDALVRTDAAYPYLAYGTDWLAFGHFVIALAFVGAYRDPIRNRWLFEFGMISCVLVVPYALAFGELRGIPLAWRGIDSLFGVIGFVPLYLARRLTEQLEQTVASEISNVG